MTLFWSINVQKSTWPISSCLDILPVECMMHVYITVITAVRENLLPKFFP